LCLVQRINGMLQQTPLPGVLIALSTSNASPSQHVAFQNGKQGIVVDHVARLLVRDDEGFFSPIYDRDISVANDDISDEVQSFIRENISSIEQLEALLLLQRDPARKWTAQELSKELYLSLEAAIHRLDDFQKRNFCVSDNADEPRYWYNPNLGRVDSIIRDLRTAYEQRRVRVINLVFSNPIDTLKSFADAFKFRKDEE
jgi:hypothetical protein